MVTSLTVTSSMPRILRHKETNDESVLSKNDHTRKNKNNEHTFQVICILMVCSSTHCPKITEEQCFLISHQVQCSMKEVCQFLHKLEQVPGSPILVGGVWTFPIDNLKFLACVQIGCIGFSDSVRIFAPNLCTFLHGMMML